jgi:hypothetical protein
MDVCWLAVVGTGYLFAKGKYEYDLLAPRLVQEVMSEESI